MSDQTQQTTSVQQATATPSGVPASGNPTAPTGTAASISTSIGSMEDLKNSAPQVYQAMMVGLAMTICQNMEDDQNRLKQLMEQYRENQNNN